MRAGALLGNALGLFGAGVYLRAITASTGWATGTVSGAVTLFYVVSAVILIPVGSGIGRVGPRRFVMAGGLAMAAGVAGIGHVSEPWHVYLLFPLMGVGSACLSTTAVATTLAPWFEEYQGRAVSIASLGASAGGMMGPPLLLLGIDRIGFTRTTSAAAALALVVLLPLALFIFRRRPEDMGLSPDGLPRCAIQLVTALGPGFYGLLHDLSGSYREPLLVAAAMDVIAAIVILRGRQKKTVSS